MDYEGALIEIEPSDEDVPLHSCELILELWEWSSRGREGGSTG